LLGVVTHASSESLKIDLLLMWTGLWKKLSAIDLTVKNSADLPGQFIIRE